MYSDVKFWSKDILISSVFCNKLSCITLITSMAFIVSFDCITFVLIYTCPIVAIIKFDPLYLGF